MKKNILFILLLIIICSCNRTNEEIVKTYESGKPMLVKTLNRQGVAIRETHYYESGQVYMQGSLKDGLREGDWQSFHPDGRTQSVGTYINGLREGYGAAYYENGNLLYEGYYHEGKECGTWKFYDEIGELNQVIER